MILPSDPLVVPQPGFRSDPVSDLSTWAHLHPDPHPFFVRWPPLKILPFDREFDSASDSSI